LQAATHALTAAPAIGSVSFLLSGGLRAPEAPLDEQIASNAGSAF
jgi:hypothetical protein